MFKTNRAKGDHHRPLFGTSWPWTPLDASLSSCDSDRDGGLSVGQGGDGVEIDELNGDHEETGQDVNYNQWWRCWWGSWWHQLLIKVLKEWEWWPESDMKVTCRAGSNAANSRQSCSQRTASLRRDRAWSGEDGYQNVEPVKLLMDIMILDLTSSAILPLCPYVLLPLWPQTSPWLCFKNKL